MTNLFTILTIIVVILVVHYLWHGRPKREFTCAKCHGVFKKELTDKEELDQLAKEFPGLEAAGCATICQDCFEILFPERVEV